MIADIVLRHRLGSSFALDAAFQFSTPGITALFGPSGSGKTTTIHAIAGLIRPEHGRIVVDGVTLLDTEKGICLAARERRMGVVFQDSRLFPHLSVKANLLYGWQRAPEKSSSAEIDHVIALLGLEQFLTRLPRTLSGGEKSRVALGRALLMRPRALLLDEPLASLDAGRKAEILPYLENLRDQTRVPILYVSHSIDEVARLATHMIVIGQGRVVADGSVFDITARIDMLTGKQMLPGTILEARIISHDPAYGLSALTIAGQNLVVPAIDRPIGDRVRIRIDAQDVMLALSRPENVSANNILAATVAAIRPEGIHADVQLKLGDAHLVARITRRSAERLGLAPDLSLFAVIKTVTVGGRERS